MGGHPRSVSAHKSWPENAVARGAKFVIAQRQGFIDNSPSIHAARPALGGLIALCGAGRIVQEAPGRFDPDDLRSCPQCGELVKK